MAGIYFTGIPPEGIPESRRTHSQRQEAARNERDARREIGIIVAGILAALYIVLGIVERMVLS